MAIATHRSKGVDSASLWGGTCKLPGIALVCYAWNSNTGVSDSHLSRLQRMDTTVGEHVEDPMITTAPIDV